MTLFKSWKESFATESQFRLDTDISKLCTYGVKCLDDAMLAINRNELIVIAATSGGGKTELALEISRHNALRGKRVAHYHLEGGYTEAVQRMKWRDISDLYFKEYTKLGIDMDYRRWTLNYNQHPKMLEMEGIVYNNLSEKIGDKLMFYNKPTGLSLSDFCLSLYDFHDLKTAFVNMDTKKGPGYNLDLIVIDHLQYFSLDKDDNENEEITKILKEAKRITDEINIPVILVSHLRKLPRGHGVCDKEDIMGTSNIHKIANTVIMIIADPEKDDTAAGIYPTYLRIAKSRIGLRPNILMSCNFDIKKRRYEDDYDLYRVFPDGSVSSEMIPPQEWPRWKGRRVYGK